MSVQDALDVLRSLSPTKSGQQRSCLHGGKALHLED